MRFWRTHAADERKPASANQALDDAFLVPQDRTALVIRNGVPEQFYLPGLHALPLGPAKVEVRLLSVDASRLPTLAPPDFQALRLPFERSFLHVDGDLVGIVKPACTGSELTTPVIEAWEDIDPHHVLHEHDLESLRACRTEPLRACLPAAGVCCGARIAA